MHKYIDVSLVRDFTKKLTAEDVVLDIKDKYKITNIADDDGESLLYISGALYDDYKYERANYESYIEEGMDARLLMELRKSAVLPACLKTEAEFYTGLANLNTWQEVRAFREAFIQKINSEYTERIPWHYYYAAMWYLGKKKNVDFLYDYESCFADGDYTKQTGVGDYQRGFYNDHVRPEFRI